MVGLPNRDPNMVPKYHNFIARDIFARKRSPTRTTYCWKAPDARNSNPVSIVSRCTFGKLSWSVEVTCWTSMPPKYGGKICPKYHNFITPKLCEKKRSPTHMTYCWKAQDPKSSNPGVYFVQVYVWQGAMVGRGE